MKPKHRRMLVFLAAMTIPFLAVPEAQATDVTASTTIQTTGLVLNRGTNTYDTAVTITNRAATPLSAPIELIVTIDVPQVTLVNASGTNGAGKPFVKLPVAISLAPAQSIQTIVRFSNPIRAKFSVTFAIDSQNGDVEGLPPEPGEAGKATLAGIDVNNNGIRDDVERYIALNVTDSARHRAALNQLAYYIQRQILSTNRSESIDFANGELKSADCLDYIGRFSLGRWKEVEALMLNTPARIRAYEASDERMGGQIFEMLQDGERRAGCLFPVESLSN